MPKLLISFVAWAPLLLLPIASFAQQEGGDKEVAFQGSVSVPFLNAGDNTTGTLIPRVGYFLSRRNFVGIENDDFFAKGYQAYGISLLYRLYLGGRGSRFQPFVGTAPGFLGQRTTVGVDLVVSPSSYNSAVQQLNALPAAQRPSALTLLNASVQAFEGGCLLQVSGGNIVDCTPIPPSTRKVKTTDFQGAGELGIKVYLNRKFAFETSYRLNYLRLSSPYAQDVYGINESVTGSTLSLSYSKTGQQDGQRPGAGGFRQNANNFVLFGFSYVF